MTDQVHRLLRELLHVEFGDAQAVAAVDLKTPEARSGMAELLRGGWAQLLAPRIYAAANGLEVLALAQYGLRVGMPAPHLTAAAMCRQHGWKLAIPVQVARFLLALAPRPDAADITELPFDQPKQMAWPKLGVVLEPGDSRLFGLTPIGQVLALGLPLDASEAGLVAIGETAGAGMLAEPRLLEWLRQDVAAALLTERELVVANAIIKAAERVGVPRRAPRDFEPPADAVAIEGWDVFEKGGLEYLTAARISGHPYLPDGDNLSRSSPLMWIDERLGWARTRSRYYRLVGQRLGD